MGRRLGHPLSQLEHGGDRHWVCPGPGRFPPGPGPSGSPSLPGPAPNPPGPFPEGKPQGPGGAAQLFGPDALPARCPSRLFAGRLEGADPSSFCWPLPASGRPGGGPLALLDGGPGGRGKAGTLLRLQKRPLGPGGHPGEPHGGYGGRPPTPAPGLPGCSPFGGRGRAPFRLASPPPKRAFGIPRPSCQKSFRDGLAGPGLPALPGPGFSLVRGGYGGRTLRHPLLRTGGWPLHDRGGSLDGDLRRKRPPLRTHVGPDGGPGRPQGRPFPHGDGGSPDAPPLAFGVQGLSLAHMAFRHRRCPGLERSRNRLSQCGPGPCPQGSQKRLPGPLLAGPWPGRAFGKPAGGKRRQPGPGTKPLPLPHPPFPGPAPWGGPLLTQTPTPCAASPPRPPVSARPGRWQENAPRPGSGGSPGPRGSPREGGPDGP